MDKSTLLYAFADLRTMRNELADIVENMQLQEKNAYQTRPDFKDQQADHARKQAYQKLKAMVKFYAYLEAA